MEPIYTGFLFAIYWFIALLAGITLVVAATYLSRWLLQRRAEAEEVEEVAERKVKGSLDEVAAIAAVVAYMAASSPLIPREEPQPSSPWKIASILYSSSSYIEEVG